MTWTYTASSHSSGNRNVLQVVAGTTENDLSGLIGLTGVTHYINANHLDVYEIASNVKIVISGTLYHNPDTEILIMHHTNAGLTNQTATTALTISGTNANPAYYYYGTTRTNSTRGTSTNSKSTGLIFTGARLSNWHPSDACISGGGGNSTFVGRGGVILTGRPCTGSLNLDVVGTTWRGTTSSLEWRNPFGNSNGSFDGTFDGVAVLLPAFNATFNFANSSIGEVINQGVITYHTLREFDVSQNIYDYDIGSDGLNGQSHREYEIINSATGSDIVKMWRNTRGSTGQRGVVVTKKEVSFNFKDASGSAIEGVELYLEDNPSAYAKNATFVKSKAFDTVNGYTASGDSPITRGVVNANGDMVYDYTTPEVYNKTSDANGDVAKFEVLTGVQIHEFNTSDSDAGVVYGMHIRSNGHWALSSTNNQGARYSDWDTANFGGFYRVDRRSDSNTNADDFTFKFCSYGHSLSTSTQALKGLGSLDVSWVLFDDTLISDSRATTDAYTEIDTPQKFYNKAKAHLVDNYAGEAQTIVTRDGITIDAGSYDVVLSSSAVNVFSLSGNTITLKTSSFTGTITTSGSVTLSGVNYTGTIIDSSGTRSFGSYEIKNLVSGSRVQVYNLTSSTEIYNDIVNATTLTQGFSTNDMVDGDSIRVRIAYQNGITAKEPQEFTVTCRTPLWEVSANQENASQYNSYQVDGSGISEFTLDLANGKIEVDISDSDNSTNIQRIGSWYYSQLMTSDGIASLFGGINWIASNQIAIDQSKVNLQLDNKKSDPLLLTGGRLYRLNETTIIAPTSNSIQIDYSPIYITNAPLIEDINKNTKLIPALL